MLMRLYGTKKEPLQYNLYAALSSEKDAKYAANAIGLIFFLILLSTLKYENAL